MKQVRYLMVRAVVGAMAWLYAGCMPDPLEVETVPAAASELVVNSQIIPDASLVVWVTRTFGALEAGDDSDPEALLEMIAVNDAIVTLRGPGGIDTLPPLGNGTYGGVAIPFETEQQYTLYVSSALYGTVHATTEVKHKVEFANVDAELFYTEYDDTLAQITYSFEDSEESNWYMINVQEIEQEDAIDNLLNPRAFTMLFDDEKFNGKSYGERFRVFPRDYHPGDTVAVSLSNISEAYYRFMKLRIDNRFSFVELVSEPVDYPSNVVGGRGYFNLYVPDVRFFVFD